MFALVDVNNMYVSCERVFDQRLVGRPVVVLSNNDGACIARSNEAKELGVKMAQPWFQVRHLERDAGLIALSANFELYGDMSSRISALFAWAAAPGSPIDVLGFAIAPSDQGARGLDADMFAADRFMRATRSTKEHWIWSASSFPVAHGEVSQDRALWGALAWATSRSAIRGLIVAEAGDYDTTIGLRASSRRLRPATASIARAIRALRENP